MTKNPDRAARPDKSEREERLAAALRANLKRRKSQKPVARGDKAAFSADERNSDEGAE